VFGSRLLLGTSGYPSPAVLRAAVAVSGTELATVSIRRLNLREPTEGFVLDQLQGVRQLLPNTAGCETAADAVWVAQLARQLLGTNWVKVEVTADEATLWPNPWQTLEACETLVKEGFVVLPYCNPDPVVCRRLADVGCAAVMPLAAPIGSGLGLRDVHTLELIRAAVPELPLIIDAGIGTASDAALALELGFDAVLVNTAIAKAQDPVRMARAFKAAVEAGREAWAAGRIPKTPLAQASSPTLGRIV
jgi:thiazole synthase